MISSRCAVLQRTDRAEPHAHQVLAVGPAAQDRAWSRSGCALVAKSRSRRAAPEHQVAHAAAHEVELVPGRGEPLTELLGEGGNVEDGAGGRSVGHDALEDTRGPAPAVRGSVGADAHLARVRLDVAEHADRPGAGTAHVPAAAACADGAASSSTAAPRGLTRLMPRAAPRGDDRRVRDRLGRAGHRAACWRTSGTTSVSTARGDRCSSRCTSAGDPATATGATRWRSAARRGGTRPRSPTAAKAPRDSGTATAVQHARAAAGRSRAGWWRRAARRPRHEPLLHQLHQRLVERLHAVELALGDHVDDLVRRARGRRCGRRRGRC